MLRKSVQLKHFRERRVSNVVSNPSEASVGHDENIATFGSQA